MKRALAAFLPLSLLAAEAGAQLVAERVTKDNAAQRLFSGSDATGGIGDWYLSNGIVQVVVDDAGFAPDLAARGIFAPIQNLLAPTGGNIIDLGLVGKNDDQLTQVFQVANLDPQNAFFYTNVSAAVTGDVARITAQGILLFGTISTPTKPTLLAQTVYYLAPNETFLTITTDVVNTGPTALPVFNVTDAFPFSGRGLLPFVPRPGRGFNNPRLVLTPQGIAAAIGLYPFVALPGNLRPEDGVMDTVTNTTCGEVTYALVPVSLAIDPDGPAGPLPPSVQPVQALIGVNSSLVSASGNPFDPTRSPLLPAGGSLTYTRRILLGPTNDVQSVAGPVYAAIYGAGAIGTLEGDLDADDTADVKASVLVRGALAPFFGKEITPMSQFTTDAKGRFSVALPSGDYTLTFISPERDDLVEVPAKVVAGTTTSVTLPKMNAVGTVRFTVTENGKPVPAKLTFLGSKNPDFSRMFDAFSFDPVSLQPLDDLQPGTYTRTPALNVVFSATGTGSQRIRPGQYVVVASHGIEYSVDQRSITVAAGAETNVSLQLVHVLDTSGWISADFHVHSAKSFDSSTPLTDRVTSYVAEGVEVLVSTDHNFITDFKPVVQSLGLGASLKTIVGNELTTSLPNPVFTQAFGHHNVFPLLVDPLAPRRGSPQTEYVNAATFYDRMLLNNPGVDKVVQLNHPRAGVAGLTIIGLFNTLHFDPTKSVEPSLLATSFLGTGRRNIDFDALEIYNGPKVGEFQQCRNDWFSLLDQGFLKTATAVSDSHRAVLETAGFPRSYVMVDDDDPARVTDAAVVAGVKARAVIGTSGPFIRFDIDGAPVGSLITRRFTPITLNIQVDAAPWVPVDQVRILANGRQVKVFNADSVPPLKPGPADPNSLGGVQRLNTSVRFNPPVDTYYTVEAGIVLPPAIDTDGDGVIDTGDTNGDGVIDAKDRGLVQPASPSIYSTVAPGFVPIAFTNPILVDRNGNGRFDPPGIDPFRVPHSKAPIARASEPKASDADYYQWFEMCIGPEEMSLFLASLTPEGRVLAGSVP